MLTALQLLIPIPVLILVGVPLARLCSRGQPLAIGLAHSLLLGAATSILAAQAGFALGYNIKAIGWPLLGIAIIVNLAIGFCSGWRRVWRDTTVRAVAPGLTASALILVLGLSVFALTHGRTYLGRLWGDQINYTLLANYFLQGPVGGPFPTDLQPQFRVVIDGGHLSDRLGQSLFHALVTWWAQVDILQGFYAVSLLSILFYFCAIYVTASTLGATSSMAAFSALLAASAPCVHAIHLESFQSQALGTPFIIYAISTTVSALQYPALTSWLAPLLAVTTTLTVYFEFFPIYAVAVAGGVLVHIWHQGRPTTWLLSVPAIVAMAGLICTVTANNPFTIMLRVGPPTLGFEKFFPWAYTWEGFARLMIGDLVIAATTSQTMLIGFAIAVLTGGALMVLARTTTTARHPLAAGVLLTMVIPFGLLALPQERSYQFYKLLQSFWPLCFLALPLVGTQSAPPQRRLVRLGSKCGRIAVAVVVLSVSFHMLAAEARTGSLRSGLSQYARMYSLRQLLKMTAGRTERTLVVSMPTRTTFNDMLANGLTILQAAQRFRRIQAKWIAVGDRQIHVPADSMIPADASTPEVRTLTTELLAHPTELLVLQVGAPFLEPASTLHTQIARHGRWTLYAPVPGAAWCLATGLYLESQKEFQRLDQAAVVRSGSANYLRIDIECAQDYSEGLSLEVTHDSPKAPYPGVWHIYSNRGYGSVFPLDKGHSLLKTGYLPMGVTEIFFGPTPIGGNPNEATGAESVTITRIVYGP
jgi:hypothetical protein